MFAGIGAVGRIGRPGLSGKKGTSLLSGMTLSLDFMQPSTLDPRITFTRASSATYTDASNVIQTAATNVPRWDYVNGVLRGLLVEDARTNFAVPSIPDPTWANNQIVVTPNAAVAPDGTNTMSKIAADTTNNIHSSQTAWGGAGAVNGARYAVSLYAKAAGMRYLQIIFDDMASYAWWVTVDLQNGTITDVQGNVLSSFIQNMGNGVYRFGFTPLNTGTATTLRASLNPHSIPNPSFYSPAYVGNGVDGVYAWGMQIEVGGFVTSYIPTTSVAVTRAQDVPTILPANIASWFVAPGGTWAAEFIETNTNFNNNRIIGMGAFNASDPTPIAIGGGFTLSQWDGANAVVSANTGTVNTIQKAISSFAPGTGKVCLNGGLVATGSMNTGFGVFSSTGINFFSVYNPGNIQNASGYLRRVLYWNRVLSDAEMQAVTT